MKTLKLFALCCGMLLAGIVSTAQVQAEDPPGLDTGNIPHCIGSKGKCVIGNDGGFLKGRLVFP